eukprot:TRINITY_DN1551_c0_g1_i4.p1 TRINITY_DN1551_c0_g1~~TRINITY_DN1551_c0_g1_i4.p1  ORF type:complete len:895 (-),score=145.35 TRINITY_DN1551_c0_g1_i4:394-2733(-)
MTGPENVSIKDEEMQGIMPRAIRQIFNDIRQKRIPLWSVKMTYLEIYNESFRDLLSRDEKEINIQESKKGVISLRNVQSVGVESLEEAMNYFVQAQKQRAVAGHDMNSRSSRSHTILTLWVELIHESGQTLRAKLNMVDLAGSERAGKTGATGKSLKEATHINKSLTFLEQVIVAMSAKKEQHVPYRSSKLTHFLKDSIGGNCKTTLVACCWGNGEQLNETLSTCRFADRMSKIHVSANKNNGLNSIHGSLFKLDPKMQSYLEQTTAAAVAREKAKLIAHLRKKGQLIGDGNVDLDEEEESNNLDDNEKQELSQLREKVKELEQMQSDIHAHKGADVVDEASAAEIEELRKKLLEMELERQHELKEREVALQQMQEGSELQQLRQRVQELKQQQELSEEQLQELQELRVQVIRLQELELQANSNQINQTQSSKELLQLQEQMKDLQVRLSAQNPEEISQSDVQELIEVRNRLEELYKEAASGQLPTSSTQSQQNQQQSHSSNSGETSGSVTQSINQTSSVPQQLDPLQITQQFASLQQTIEDLKQQLQLRSSISEIPIINAPQLTIPDLSSTQSPPSILSSQYESNFVQRLSINGEESKKKKKKIPKILRKLFSKKKKGQAAFPDPFQAANAYQEEQGQNIVILNSLTHAQLTELLKAHNINSNHFFGQQQQQQFDDNLSQSLLTTRALQELGPLQKQCYSQLTTSGPIDIAELDSESEQEHQNEIQYTKQIPNLQETSLSVVNEFIRETENENDDDSRPSSASDKQGDNGKTQEIVLT